MLEGIPVETPDTTNTQVNPAADSAATGAPAGAGTTAAAAAANNPAAAAKPAAKTAKKNAGTADSTEAEGAAQAAANPQTVTIWPLRSYQDAGEIKRRGGPSYTAPKRHADALITRGLATDEKPAKAKPETNE